MRLLTAAFSGGLFGAGLVVSGMTDTAKVQGFLDLFGAWDITLMFVMGGAILPMAIAWRIAAHREHALLGSHLPSPPSTRIDSRLVAGGVLFGAGWALSGFCPGPAFASVSFGGSGGLVFLVSMLIGMGVARPAIPLLFRPG